MSDVDLVDAVLSEMADPIAWRRHVDAAAGRDHELMTLGMLDAERDAAWAAGDEARAGGLAEDIAAFEASLFREDADAE